MADITPQEVAELRDDFEAWVGNPHMLDRKTAPGYADEYEHPWTSGAWAAWKKCYERSPAIDEQAAEIERLREALQSSPRWLDVAKEVPRNAQEVLFVRDNKTVHGAWIGGIF